MPSPGELPPGPLRDLVQALHHIYRDAGKPGVRAISEAIRDREDLPDTVSHETISTMLRGGLAKWVKVESVVRQLAMMAVDRPESDAVVRHFHRLWLAASDESAATRVQPPHQVRRDFVAELPPVSDDGRAAPAEQIDSRNAPGTLISNAPERNTRFVGRLDLLRQIRTALAESRSAPVVLHGLAGVGKSQLAIEYAHRWSSDYDVIWWIPAEHQSPVRGALATLGERLDLPTSADLQQTAQTVLNALESSALRWLLVYDNADLPDDLRPLLAASGGHTLVTTRNPAWSSHGHLLDVDVFVRDESVELLCRQGQDISPDEAEHLAQLLGDLPLALDQVAAMQAATGLAVGEYLQLYTTHLAELLATSRRRQYPDSVATAITVAFHRLRMESVAATQLLELFTYLGPEPVQVTLLRAGSAVLPPSLGRTVLDPASLERVLTAVRRFGLARVAGGSQSIQVHRLVPVILRDNAEPAERERIRTSVRRLLAQANPGDPDDPRTWPQHRELSTHIQPAQLIEADEPRARQVVLDQIRYLYRSGDYREGRHLGELVVARWSRPPAQHGLGLDHEQTLTATQHLCNLLRELGHYTQARVMTSEALDRLRASPQYGDDHPQTLAMARSDALNLRVTGDYRQALERNAQTVQRHRRVYGADDPRTMAAMSDLAVSLRLTGNFVAAHQVDQKIVASQRARRGATDLATLVWTSNLALDLYGLGRYAEALRTVQSIWPAYVERQGSRVRESLGAGRTIAIAERKIGRVPEALRRIRELRRECHAALGPDHDYTLLALMSYANALRGMGDLVGARGFAIEALSQYRQVFSANHPLALAAAVNLAVILRALGDRHEAQRIDQVTVHDLREVLGGDHPFTLVAEVGLANDLVGTHEREAARVLSARTWEAMRRTFGEDHPDTLACAVNAALDGRAVGDETSSAQLLAATARRLRETLGVSHVLTQYAISGRRVECDIEPPLT